LDWDLWLGPAAGRPYSPEYVPKHWRRYWAFGGGTLSDMACHYMDLPFWALDLRHPLSVEAEGPGVDPEGTPEWLTVRYEHPARGHQPPVKLTWYHGVKDGKDHRPPLFARGGLPDWGNGVLFIGDKGMLLAGYWDYLLLPKPGATETPKARTKPKREDDYETVHHQEWINAIKTGGKTSCNFDYAGALTEAVLLGNVAYRSGAKVTWDAEALRAVGNAQAEEFIQHHYRSGWSI
jgi:predicted dehydrogenase